MKCPSCGRTFAPDNEEIFMKENKIPYNSDSPRQKNITVHYTNPDGVNNENPYDEIFSPVQRNISQENYSASNESSPHNPNLNPYSDMDNHFEKAPSQPTASYNPYSREVHTTEFIPKDIVEFAKHMDARSRSKELRFLFYGMPAIGLLSIFTDCLVDTSAATVVYMIIHAVILTIFGILMKKTYSKIAAVIFSVYTFIYALIMIASYNLIYNITINYTYVIFAYLPICCQVSLNIMLIIALTDYYNAWEIYRQTGTVPPKSTAFADKMSHLDEWIRNRS